MIFNRLVKCYLLITLASCANLVSNADHIVGGELTYECVDAEEGLYKVKLSLFRDCLCENGDSQGDCTSFDATANITIFNNGNVVKEELNLAFRERIEPNIDGLCLETVPDLCIERSGGYEKVLKLTPNNHVHTIVYQRCCRNSTIVNIEEPDQTGSTYVAVVPANNVAQCNNSPVFNSYPPIVICAGFPIEFDYSATDIDGDSLVYELCEPLKGASRLDPKPVQASFPSSADSLPRFYEAVNWVDGFNVNNQIGSDPQIKVDAQTGFLEGTPLRAGQYVVGICIKEYRNDELISTMARDFQFNVADCGIVKAKIKADEINEDGTFVIQACEGYEIEFLNESIGAESYIWNFGDANSFDDFSINRNTSYEYTDTGKYIVQLIADPNETCTDTAYLQLNMYPTEQPKFTWSGGCTDDAVQFTDLSITDFGNITNWQWYFGGSNWGSTQQNPIIEIDNVSNIEVKLNVTTDLGCQLSTTETIDLDIVPIPLMEHGKLCLNAQPIQFTDLSTVSSGNITDWKWIVYDENLNELYNTNTQLMEYTFEAGTYFINLQITGNNGCSNSIQNPIKLNDKLAINAFKDVEICENDFFEISLNANTTIDYFEWTPFDETITFNNQSENPKIFPQKSDEYIVTAFDLNGCSATDTFDVSLYKAPLVNIGNDTLICYRQQVFLQPQIESFYDGNITYEWENNAVIINRNQFNQFLSPDTSGIYRLNVVESTHGCTTTDSIFIKVDQPIVPEVINDTIVCPGSTVNLYAKGGDTYNWFSSNQPIGETAEIEITPYNNVEYTVNIANACFNAESSIKVDVFDLPIIDAGDDIEIEVGKTYTLNPIFDKAEVLNFYWTSDKDYLPSYNEKSITFSPYENSWYALNIISTDNCLVIDTINVNVKNVPDIFLPNAFSPNGDGVNDIIVPVLKGIQQLSTFAIYDRYGKKIFQTNSSEIAWDGIYNSQPLAMGVYVYFVNGLTFFNEPFSKKGNITLVR